MKNTQNQQTTLDTLFQLIKENPELKVVPLVDMEAVDGPEYYRYLGSIGKVQIDALYFSTFNGETYFKSIDENTVLADNYMTYLQSENWDWDEERIEKEVEKFMSSVPWEKVITVNIDGFEKE